MGLLITLWVLGLVVFAFGVWLSSREAGWCIAGWVISPMGAMFLAVTTFVGVPQELPSGLPKTSIDAGEYEVAFVYVAGENVNLGVEKERLYLYQFPKSAFDSGSMNTEPKKLVVTEWSGFRKLVLE